VQNRSKYLAKNTGILSISSFSSKILIFFLVPIYTSVLSTAEYGSFDLITSTLQLIMPIVTCNIYEGVMRFAMEKSVDKKQVASIGIKYIALGTGILGFFIIINNILDIWQIFIENSLLIFLYFFSNVLNQYLIQLTKGLEKVRDMAIAGVLSTIVTVSLNIIFLLYLKLGLQGFYLSYIIGFFISALFLMLRIRYHQYLSYKIDKSLEKEMTHYSAPLIMNSLGWWANNASDRYVVTWLCGIAVNGVYSVSYKVPSIFAAIQQIFIQAWQISAVKEHNAEDSKRFYGRALDSLNYITCLLCMLLILFVKVIATILFQKDFFEAWVYVPFLLVSGVFNSASGILGPVLTANMNAKAMGISALIGSLSNIVLNIILVIPLGAQGAAIATAISSFIIYECRKWFSKELVDFVKYPRMLFSWTLIICQAILMIYTHKYWLQVLMIFLLCIIYLDTLKDIIRIGKEIASRK